jgi:carboxypeptidase C (cathepsin A)
MTGLFVQNGPFIIDEGGKLHLRSNAWTLSRSIIYMDSPVGTGELARI